jgi:hypothetical protein
VVIIWVKLLGVRPGIKLKLTVITSRYRLEIPNKTNIKARLLSSDIITLQYSNSQHDEILLKSLTDFCIIQITKFNLNEVCEGQKDDDRKARLFKSIPIIPVETLGLRPIYYKLKVAKKIFNITLWMF